LNANTLNATIDSTQNALKDPLIRNFQKYPLFGKKIWPNYYVGSTISDEVSWLKNWMQGRLTWLDAQMALFDNPILGNELAPVPASVYPNPSKGLFYWKFNLEKPAMVTYFISDALGRVQMPPKSLNLGAGEQNYPIDLSNFSAGSYILSWDTGDGLVQQINLKIAN
jgi:hypothetical protein